MNRSRFDALRLVRDAAERPAEIPIYARQLEAALEALPTPRDRDEMDRWLRVRLLENMARRLAVDFVTSQRRRPSLMVDYRSAALDDLENVAREAILEALVTWRPGPAGFETWARKIAGVKLGNEVERLYAQTHPGAARDAHGRVARNTVGEVSVASLSVGSSNERRARQGVVGDDDGAWIVDALQGATAENDLHELYGSNRQVGQWILDAQQYAPPEERLSARQAEAASWYIFGADAPRAQQLWDRDTVDAISRMLSLIPTDAPGPAWIATRMRPTKSGRPVARNTINATLNAAAAKLNLDDVAQLRDRGWIDHGLRETSVKMLRRDDRSYPARDAERDVDLVYRARDVFGLTADTPRGWPTEDDGSQ